MNSPMGTRRLSTHVVAVLLAACTALGCAGKSANAPPPNTAASAAAEDDIASGLVEHHRYHHHGGVTLFIAMSLDTLGVSPEQRAKVENIRTDLHTRMQPALAADQNLAAALADGLDASQIDATKVDAAVAQVAAAAATVHDASAEALNELHTVLNPPERAALVDKVQSHWAVWQRANAEDTGASAADGGHLAALTADLGLTPDQVGKIRSNLNEGLKAVPRLDPHEVDAHLHAFGDAFRSEQFDAKALTTANGVNAHLAGWGAAHLAHLVEAVSPVLDADQRARLSQQLREHAAHNPSASVTP
jgi:Spy/CpxP family protein refolding chaperone